MKSLARAADCLLWALYCLITAVALAILFVVTGIRLSWLALKFAVAALLALFLSGCMAGITRYEIRPECPFSGEICQDPGKWLYSAKVTSGKNAGSVVVHIVRTADGGVTFDLNEQQINGSESIKAAAAPVSDVARAVSDTAITVQKLEGKLP